MFDHNVPGIANEPEDIDLIERDVNVVSLASVNKPNIPSSAIAATQNADDVSWLLRVNSVQELKLKAEKKHRKRLKATIQSKDDEIAELKTQLKFAVSHGLLRTRFSFEDLAYRTAWISVPIVVCGAGLSVFFI